MNKVYEPSEIHVHRKKIKRTSLEFEAWMRLLARFVDYAIFMLLVSLVLWIPRRDFSLNYFEITNPFLYLMWALIEGFLLSRVKTTFGKYLLHIRVIFLDRKKVGYAVALNRSLLVWFRGIALGIPVLNLFTMYYAFAKYKRGQKMSWDVETKANVVQGKVAIWRIVVAVLIILSVGVAYFL